MRALMIVRRSMVKSMAAAGQVPHFHLLDELILTRLVALRARLREDPAMSGAHLTFLPFILKVGSRLGRHAPRQASDSPCSDR